MKDVFELAIVLVCDEVGDGLAEIPEEAIAGFRTPDDVAGKHRKPGSWIVTAQLFELGNHVVGPVQRASLPAVVDYVVNACLPISPGPTVSL